MADIKGKDHPGVRSPRFPRSKFHAPSAPSRLVRRSRLLDALDRGRGARLTVVVGSPGAGKTALLADWLAAHPERPAAWLSCDRADAEPGPVCGGHHRSPASRPPSAWTGRGRPPAFEPRRRGVGGCDGRPGRRPGRAGRAPGAGDRRFPPDRGGRGGQPDLVAGVPAGGFCSWSWPAGPIRAYGCTGCGPTKSWSNCGTRICPSPPKRPDSSSPGSVCV